MSLALRLKHETAAAHARIEREIDLPRRLRSVGDYRGLLQRFHGFHAEWEARARLFFAAEPIFSGRWRLPALEADLRALGMSRAAIASLPRCLPSMPIDGAADAWGAAYVVEGSTLGGAVIAAMVRRDLGYEPERGCAYFAGYGRGSAAMWASFRQRLDSISAPGTDDAVIASALATFERLRTWLNGDAARAAA